MPSICSQSSPSTPSPLMMPLHCFLLLFFQETPLLFIFFSVELFILCYFNFGGPHRVACGVSVPQPGIKPVPPALEVYSPNHCTTGKSLPLHLTFTQQTIQCQHLASLWGYSKEQTNQKVLHREKACVRDKGNFPGINPQGYSNRTAGS